MRMPRRDFLRAAAAMSVSPALAPPLAASETQPNTDSTPVRWAGYDDAIVIDFLGSPGYFNYPENPPLDAAMIENARTSGITAMNVTVNGGDFESTIRRMSPWLSNVDRYPETFRQVRTVEQLMDAKATGRVGIVLGFQDTTPFGTDLSTMDVFYEMGVRVVQLTYNVRNMVGDGCLEPGNAGLSSFGIEVVERLNELGMMVDLSHCGKRTTSEGIRASSAPPAITHSGCNAVEPHPRSKDNEELRALADRGGVIGIYLMPFLTPGRVPTTADVVAHIEHALETCGEDHVGIGSDLSITPIDGSDEYWSKHREFVAGRIARGVAAPAEDPDVLFTVPELNSHRRMDLIADALSARGHSDGVIEKVIGANWVRLLREVWG
ncbi:MAG: peptidase M19, renal dipeptidase [Gemmatimonadales bacterium]|jgi:membrane dipeptidase|nr:peptidase M19, renal dipeptidase [Gemmatimonadales bacterium]